MKLFLKQLYVNHFSFSIFIQHFILRNASPPELFAQDRITM